MEHYRQMQQKSKGNEGINESFSSSSSQGVSLRSIGCGPTGCSAEEPPVTTRNLGVSVYDNWTYHSTSNNNNQTGIQNVSQLTSSSESLREAFSARSNYSTKNTIGIANSAGIQRQIRTSSGINSLIHDYQESSYHVYNELGGASANNFPASSVSPFSAAQMMPTNYKSYQQSQLQPIKNSTSGSLSQIGYKGNLSSVVGDKPLITPGYFFESPSKYISLKQTKDTNSLISGTGASSTTSQSCSTSSVSAATLFNWQYQTPVFDSALSSNQEIAQQPRYTQKNKGVKDWFERLCLQDKSIVLTVVDKQLVNLIYSMFKVYSQEGNVKFQNNQYSPQEAHEYERVKNYNLLYKRLSNRGIQGSQSQFSAYVKRIHEAENALINSVRLLSVLTNNNQGIKKVPETQSASSGGGKKKGGANQAKGNKQSSEQGTTLQQTLEEQYGGSQYINQFDALTLDLQFFKNVQYFFEIMRLAKGHNYFMTQDMSISKEMTRLDHSIFYEDTSKGRRLNDDPTSFYQSAKPRQANVNAELPQKFWTFVHPDENLQDIQSGMTLGKCLLLIFEKAINVQYNDCMNRLDKHQQQFFFLSDPSTYNNIFVQDQRLTIFCTTKLSPHLRDQVLKHLDTIEQSLISEEHLKCTQISNTISQGASKSLTKPFVIRESEEDECCSSDNNNNNNAPSSMHKKQQQHSQRLKNLFQKEDEEIEGILSMGETSSDEEDSDNIATRYQREQVARTRGIASSRCQFNVNEQIDEEDEDPEAYKYPKINRKGNDNHLGSTQIFDYEDDEEDCTSDVDLESQKPFKKSSQSQEICFAGRTSGSAVAKLKALRSSRAAAVASNNNRVVLQSTAYMKGRKVNEGEDDEEVYESDFEEDESHKQEDEMIEEDDETTYFMELDSKYKSSKQSSHHNSSSSKFQIKNIDSKFTTSNLQLDANPLLSNNKYFFLKQDLQKQLYSITSEHTSKDQLDIQAFTFIKNLSSFIGLETVFSAATSPQVGQSQTMKTLNFSSSRQDGNLITGISTNNASTTSTTDINAIPFRQRLYKYLVKLYEDSSWEDILEVQNINNSTVVNATKHSSNKPETTTNNKNTITNETNKPVITALGKTTVVGQASESNSLVENAAGGNKSKKKNRKKERKQKKREQNELQQAALNKQIIEIEMEDLSKRNSNSNNQVKSEKGKKKEEESPEETSSSEEDGERQAKGGKVDLNSIKQIKQERLNIEYIKEQMMKSNKATTKDWPSINFHQDQNERDLYNDSCSGLPPASLISMGLKMSFPQDEELEIKVKNQERYIEERKSLLTGKFQKDKYSDDFYANHQEQTPVTKFDSSHMLQDPTVIPDRPSHLYSYQATDLIQRANPLNNDDGDVDMLDETAADPTKDCTEETKEQGKKKKRKKNKKNKKKNGLNEEQPPLVTDSLTKHNQDVSDDIEVIELQDIVINVQNTSYVAKQDNKLVSSSINLDIEEEEVASSEARKINNYLEIEPKLTFELTQEDKDFIEATRRLDEEIGEEIELFESTQLLTEEVASTLIQGAIEHINIEDDKVLTTSAPSKEPTPFEIIRPTPESKQSIGGKKGKKNKKGGGANPQQPQQPQQQAQKTASKLTQQPQTSTVIQGKGKKQKKAAQKAKKAQIESEKKISNEGTKSQQQQVIEEIIIEEDNEEEVKVPESNAVVNLDNLKAELVEESKQGEDTTQANEEKSQTRKVVEFNVMNNIRERQIRGGYYSSSADDQDSNIKVPKRGSSSRGSSCTEEKIHQDTISMLGDLFPQQYKNPSDDTKEIISKITSSSSGSQSVGNGSAFSSPEMNITQPALSINSANKAQRPSKLGSKFIEEPYEPSNFANQNKRQKGQNPKNQQNVSSFPNDQGALRIKPNTQKGGNKNQQQTQSSKPQQPVPPKSSSAQPLFPKQEFEGYDALFKSQVCEIDHQVKIESAQDNLVKQQTVPQLTILNEQSIELESDQKRVQTSNRQGGGGHKTKKAQKEGTQQNPPIVKEMKERGAIARPSDIEQANQHKTVGGKKAHQKQHLQETTVTASQVPPKSQTPNVELGTESMLVVQQLQHAKGGPHLQGQNPQHHNSRGNKGGIGASIGAINQQLNSVQGNKPQQQQQNLASSGGQKHNQSKKKNVNSNQQNAGSKVSHQSAQQAFEQILSPEQLANQAQFNPAQFVAQQQQMFNPLSFMAQPQQPQAIFANQQLLYGGNNVVGMNPFQYNPMGSNTNLIGPQQQAQGVVNPATSQYGMLSPGFFGQNNNLFSSGNSMIPTQGLPQQNFINPQMTLNESYDQSQESFSQQQLQERSTQHTQTDETRIKDAQMQQQPSQVINQYQNINVQVHLPQQNTNSNPNLLLGQNAQANPFMNQNQFLADILNQQQQFQVMQQMLLQQQTQDPAMIQQMLALNPLMQILQFGNPNQTPFPSFNQNFMQGNPLYNAASNQLLLSQQFPQLGTPQLNHSQSLHNSQAQQLLLNQSNNMGASHSHLHKSHSFRSPTLNHSSGHGVGTHHHHHHANNNYQHQHTTNNPYTPSTYNNSHQQSSFNHQSNNQQSNLFQEILNQIAQQSRLGTLNGSLEGIDVAGMGAVTSNIQNDATLHNNGNQQSQISHVSQDKQCEMYVIQEREEQFYNKVDQQIYQVQEKLKFKVSSIEIERGLVLRKIEMQVRETYTEYPEARIQMYGSMATGLAIDSSDMDLLISGVFPPEQQRQMAQGTYNQFPRFIERNIMIEQMQKFYKDISVPKTNEGSPKSLKIRDFLHSSSIIETASVPVIKLVIDLQKIRDKEAQKQGMSSNQIQEDMRFLKIDITFNDQQQQQLDPMYFNQPPFNYLSTMNIHMGIQCCNFIIDRLRMYPILEPLSLILKKFLAVRNMNSPFQGGLNSYGLIILIIAYLNQNFDENYGHDGILSKARALKGFLFYYGYQFDQNQFMINSDQHIVLHQSYSSVLIIQDPLNSQNNIGKSTFNFDMIRAEFARAHDAIDQLLQEYLSQEMQAEESAEGGPSHQVIWKKKLDVLNKILYVPSSSSSSSSLQPGDIIGPLQNASEATIVQEQQQNVSTSAGGNEETGGADSSNSNSTMV